MQIGEYFKQSIAASLKCVGTGNGYPSSHRSHSCYIYEFGQTTVMIDCGEPASANYKRLKIDWNIPDALLISHLHFDHCGSIFMLLQGMYLEKRTNPLSIYVPEDGINHIRELLTAASFVPEVVTFQIQFEKLQDSIPICLNDVRIIPSLNSHFNPFKQKVGNKYSYKYESFSFLITGGNKKIFHTSDVGGIEDLSPVLENDVDVLVCELSHIKPEQLFEYLENSKLERVILVHLDRRYRKKLEELKSLANKMLPNVVWVIPEDGAEISLETKQTSV